jgi:hypothetical protein
MGPRKMLAVATPYGGLRIKSRPHDGVAQNHCKTLSPEEHASRGAKHMASTFALFHNQPEVLFSFICKVD